MTKRGEGEEDATEGWRVEVKMGSRMLRYMKGWGHSTAA